jgi:Firmicute plasmid replication protein (RepL)
MRKEAYLLFKEDDEYSESGKDIAVYINPKSKFKDGFCLSWSEGLMMLSDMSLTSSQYRILLILIAEIEFENYCYINQSYITERTGISQPNVSKNISVLIKRHLIFRENTKRGKAFRVNSRIAWKGSKTKAFSIAFEKDSQYELA